MTSETPNLVAIQLSATFVGLSGIYLLHPPCPIHALTGLLCPGCGTTRALTALLHGRILESLHQNSLAILLLPIFLAYSVRAACLLSWPRIPPQAIYLALAATAAFTILRNLA